MPPRGATNLTSQFSLADANNEVVCPLRNQDASSCRKRCLGEKRYRSMQEHIRRAHPEYYIPKLPATKESFELMITSPPHEHPPPQDPSPQQHHSQAQVPQLSDPSGGPYIHHQPVHQQHTIGQHDGGYYTAGDADAAAIYNSMQEAQRSSDEYRRGSLIPAASAAAALAQLHYHRGPDSDWGGDGMGQSYYADQHADLKTSPNAFHVDPTLEEANFMQDHTNSFPPSSSGQDAPAVGGGGGSLLPSSLARSPPDRHTLPPLQRSLSRPHARPRKSSLSQQARLAKHERKKSRELGKRISGDRKAFSAEPTSAAALYGKRWEDLIDAATSATEEEEGSRDLTPIPASPYQSPPAAARGSMPPFALGSQFQSFQASPLNRALTPPPADSNLDLQPFPSVESSLSSALSNAHGGHGHHDSADSGSQFQIMNPGSLDSSPMFQTNNTNTSQPGRAASTNGGTVSGGSNGGSIQIYCAGCKRLNCLKESYACTNCICGLCATCVEALVDNQRTGRMSGCPRCSMNYGSFKPFQLDLR